MAGGYNKEQAEGGTGLQFYTPGDKPTKYLSQSLSLAHMKSATSDSIHTLYPTIASAKPPSSYQFQLSGSNLQGNEFGVDATHCKTACHEPEARMSTWPPYL